MSPFFFFLSERSLFYVTFFRWWFLFSCHVFPIGKGLFFKHFLLDKNIKKNTAIQRLFRFFVSKKSPKNHHFTYKKMILQKHPTNPGDKRKWHRVEDFLRHWWLKNKSDGSDKNCFFAEKIFSNGKKTHYPPQNFSMDTKSWTFHNLPAWEIENFPEKTILEFATWKISGGLSQHKKERKIGNMTPRAEGLQVLVFWILEKILFLVEGFGVLILILKLSLKQSWRTIHFTPPFFFKRQQLLVS